MPTTDTQAHLDALYARSDDPWNTHTSAYEKAKFAQTLACLPRMHYRRALEVGCGAGALSAQLALRCDALVAMDCTGRALASARAQVARPNITFQAGVAPADWVPEAPDLVILSEVLYFLTDEDSRGLAQRIVQDCAPGCDVVLVNWLGDTGGLISGAGAAERLIAHLSGCAAALGSHDFGQFRIDVLRAGTEQTAPDLFGRTAASARHGAGMVAGRDKLRSGARRSGND